MPMKPIQTPIKHSFLPLSIDDRLYPDTNLSEGPMRDCFSALNKATEAFQILPLSGSSVRPDPTKTGVVWFGWFGGGQLSTMSLGYTAPVKRYQST